MADWTNSQPGRSQRYRQPPDSPATLCSLSLKQGTISGSERRTVLPESAMDTCNSSPPPTEWRTTSFVLSLRIQTDRSGSAHATVCLISAAEYSAPIPTSTGWASTLLGAFYEHAQASFG